MKTAIFFDLDDTLYDHQAPLRRAVATIWPDVFVDTAFYNRFRHASDVAWKQYVRGEMTLAELRYVRIAEVMDRAITRGEAEQFQQQYEAELAQIACFPEVDALIRTLQQRYDVVGIMTNGPVDHQRQKLAQLNLLDFIGEAHCYISDALPFAKPNPDVFRYVAAQYHLAPGDCLYVGDTWENDVVAPIEAGWSAIWLNHRDRKPKTAHQPLRTIHSLRELCINEAKLTHPNEK